MVESHHYQQTQHAVCLPMINVLYQCGPPAKKQGDGRFLWDFFFSPLLPVFIFFFHTHCYQPNWMISGGILPLSGVFAVVCRFCLQVWNSLKLEESFIQRPAFFQLSIKQASRWGQAVAFFFFFSWEAVFTLLLAMPCQPVWTINTVPV